MPLQAWNTTLLPLPLLAPHSYLESPQFVRSNMDSGYARQRRRFTSVPVQFKASINLSQDQATYFEYWFNDRIAGGSDWFEMSMLVGNGLQTHQVRFIGPYSLSMSSNRFLYSFTLEALTKSTETLTADQAWIVDQIGFDAVSELFADMEYTVNTVMPATNP